MQQFNSAEIHFHQQDTISVYVESTLADDQERIGEIGLLCFYAVRMLSNLGPNATSQNLAAALANVSGGIDVLASPDDPFGFKLISYPGHPGRHSFHCSFDWTTQQLTTNFKTKGFGFFAKGMGYYGPTSVLAFARFLVLKRSTDLQFRKSIAVTLGFCAEVFRSGKLTLGNHNQLTLTAMGICASNLENSTAPVKKTPEAESTDSKTNYSNALSFIAQSLNDTHESFADDDFTAENGVRFRNHFLGFPAMLFDTMQFFLEERKEDEWVQRNSENIPRLSSEELVALSGNLQFFAECRKLNLSFHRRSADEIALRFDCGARITLDWIVNTYELDSKLPRSWHKLVQENADPIAFQHAGRALLRESLSALFPWEVSEDCDLWPAMAMIADLDRPKFDDDKWTKTCLTIFEPA